LKVQLHVDYHNHFDSTKLMFTSFTGDSDAGSTRYFFFDKSISSNDSVYFDSRKLAYFSGSSSEHQQISLLTSEWTVDSCRTSREQQWKPKVSASRIKSFNLLSAKRTSPLALKEDCKFLKMSEKKRLTIHVTYPPMLIYHHPIFCFVNKISQQTRTS
jgi:hypothetical protein